MTSGVDRHQLTRVISERWRGTADKKSGHYVEQFFERTIVGHKISGKVVGNHGTYMVSITANPNRISSACSCYIGRGGRCHHVTALALTFLRDPDSFAVAETPDLGTIEDITQLRDYLRNTTLDELTQRLRQAGITQKDFAESIGMNPRQITVMKSSERRNRFFGELGATKLACLWMLEHFSPDR